MDFEGFIVSNWQTPAKKRAQRSAVTMGIAGTRPTSQVTKGSLNLASQNAIAPFFGLVLTVNPAIAP